MPKYEMKMWNGSAYVDVPIGGSGGAGITRYTGSLSNTLWDAIPTPSGGGYTQTVTINGITSEDTPLISMIGSDDSSSNETLAAEWAKIYRAETFANGITFRAYEKPSQSLQFQVMNITGNP